MAITQQLVYGRYTTISPTGELHMSRPHRHKTYLPYKLSNFSNFDSVRILLHAKPLAQIIGVPILVSDLDFNADR